MSRRPRQPAPGIYHVATRGAGPAPVFLDDDDRTAFCSLLIRTLALERWICRAFVFMTTHYHLLLEVFDESLPAGMRRLNGQYARAFNLRHGRKGHLFGERYHDVRVETEEHLLQSVRSIARNPVKAGMCARPSEWLWSSYPGCAGLGSEFPFVDSSLLLGCFGADGERARSRLRAFVEAD